MLIESSLADIPSWLFVHSVSCERLSGENAHCGQNLTKLMLVINKAHACAGAGKANGAKA